MTTKLYLTDRRRYHGSCCGVDWLTVVGYRDASAEDIVVVLQKGIQYTWNRDVYGYRPEMQYWLAVPKALLKKIGDYREKLGFVVAATNAGGEIWVKRV